MLAGLNSITHGPVRVVTKSFGSNGRYEVVAIGSVGDASAVTNDESCPDASASEPRAKTELR